MLRRLFVIVVCGVLAGCAGTTRRTPPPEADFELLQWKCGNVAFEQDHALEASGLTFSGSYFYAVAEKYATLLQIDPHNAYSAVAVPLDLPPGAETEGVAWSEGALYICDEAHAAVYRVTVDEERLAAGDLPGPLTAPRVPLHGLSIEGGKVGFEGVAVDLSRDLLYLLLERSGDEDTGCSALIFPLQISETGLHSEKKPLVVPLEDCNWRLAGLGMRQNRLLAIKSQYPGERYRLLEVDPESGEVERVADITELGRSLPDRGFGNNLEGIAVGPDGGIYLVGDNADIPRALHPLPPESDQKTVFLKILWPVE